MVTPPDETTADPYAVIAALRAERDAALRALAELLESTVLTQCVETRSP
jgi:hypothetical protein